MRSESVLRQADWHAPMPRCSTAQAAELFAIIGEGDFPTGDEGSSSLLADFVSRTAAAGGVLTIHAPGGALEVAAGITSDLRLEPLMGVEASAEPSAAPQETPGLYWRGATPAFPWHRLSAAVGSDGAARAVVSLFFPAGSALDRDEATFATRSLQPGAARYMRLWLRHRAGSRVSRLLEETLQELDFGLLLLDQDGRIMFENAAAGAMLDRGSAVYRCRGSVCAREPLQAVSLRLAIDRALFRPTAKAQADATSSPLIPLGTAGAAPQLLAAVSAVGEAAAVYLFEGSGVADRTIAAMARWHGLSPVETQLVAMLAAGNGVPEIAQGAAIKEDTVRTYLKNVFRKTGARSQADLIRLMMSKSVCVRGRHS